jgi:hypothetical protein
MKRDNVEFPRVTRAVLPRDELYTTDLETGLRTKKLVFCSFHHRYEWIAYFYKESKSNAKHSNDVRRMCIEGWDITEGKLFWNKPVIKRPKKESATLVQFFEEHK